MSPVWARILDLYGPDTGPVMVPRDLQMSTPIVTTFGNVGYQPCGDHGNTPFLVNRWYTPPVLIEDHTMHFTPVKFAVLVQHPVVLF